MVERLWLVKNGVPFETAMSVSDDERIAYTVIFAGFEGQEFDWDTLQYRRNTRR